MKNYYFFIFIFLPFLGFTQLTLKDTKTVVADNISIDKLGNIYLINSGEIVKFDKKFNRIADYSNNLLGDIDFVDVSNPFRVMLYYRDFNRIVFLDSNLAELKSPLALDQLGAMDITAVCYSISGGFWVYSNNTSQVFRFSERLQKELKGVELGAVGAKGNAVRMIETTKHIFVLFENDYIFILDRFGSYYKKIRFDNIIDFAVKDNTILSLANNVITATNIVTMSQNTIPLLTEKVKAFDIFGNHLYCLTDTSLITFFIE